MKKILLAFTIIALFVSFTNKNPNANPKDCECGLEKAVKEYTKSNNYISQDSIKIKKLSDEEVRIIRNGLCMNILYATDVGFNIHNFKSVILEGLDEENASNSNLIVAAFLNTYKQKLVCTKDESRKNSRDLHIYKQAILVGVIDLFDEILLDIDLFQIDFNAYEIVDGKKETVLDYIDKLILTGVHDTEELELLKDDIEDVGGKRGHQL